VSCAKAAEPIEMQFGMLRLVGPGNHVLDGCACYRNYYINFNNILHNDKDHQVLYSSSLVGDSIVPQMNPRWIMADGCHFANIDKSPHLGNGLTDRHEI